jgi:Spy/CpxP family protein refolding chaperone
MSIRLQILGLGLGLLLCSLSASAQDASTPELPTAPAPELSAASTVSPESIMVAVPERAKQQVDYLADALQLKSRQVATLRAALQARLDAAEVLSHLLFASPPAATAAFEAIDYRYYAAMGKVLTPNQFHKLLQLDEQATTEVEAPMVLHGH